MHIACTQLGAWPLQACPAQQPLHTGRPVPFSTRPRPRPLQRPIIHFLTEHWRQATVYNCSKAGKDTCGQIRMPYRHVARDNTDSNPIISLQTQRTHQLSFPSYRRTPSSLPAWRACSLACAVGARWLWRRPQSLCCCAKLEPTSTADLSTPLKTLTLEGCFPYYPLRTDPLRSGVTAHAQLRLHQAYRLRHPS